MKKIYLLCSILLCCVALPSFAQTITFNEPRVINLGTVVFTAVGETSTHYIHAASLCNSCYTISSSAGGSDLSEYFTLGGLTVTPYNCSTGQGTTISFKITNTGEIPTDINITLNFMVTFDNCTGGIGTTKTGIGPTFISMPPGEVYESAGISKPAYRDNCSPPTTPIGITYNVSLGHNTSTISQADADNQANAYWNSTEAAYADAHGSCSVPPAGSFAFTITNTSGNSASISFINAGTPQVGGVVPAHLVGSATFWIIPELSYEVIISPAGSPVSCTMTFNTGQTAGPSPGHTFTGIDASSTVTNSLSIH